VSYGRIGSAGQQVRKEFESPERARAEMEKLVAEKLRKGYVAT
jgi:predicted DNA-binding WGR domain protein